LVFLFPYFVYPVQALWFSCSYLINHVSAESPTTVRMIPSIIDN
jgi:hypothetical protein